jgi:hypothetical protein
MMKFLAAVTVVLVFASGSAAARSASGKKTPSEKTPSEKTPTEPSMQVRVTRSVLPGCDPDCPEWIAAQGRIDPGSANQFKKILRGLGERRLPVFNHSGGGAPPSTLSTKKCNPFLRVGFGCDPGLPQSPAHLAADGSASVPAPSASPPSGSR